MAGVALHRLEGGIQGSAADGVIDYVEAFTLGVSGQVLFDRDRAIVDRHSAESFHDAALVRRDGGEDFRPEGARNLNGELADAQRESRGPSSAGLKAATPGRGCLACPALPARILVSSGFTPRRRRARKLYLAKLSTGYFNEPSCHIVSPFVQYTIHVTGGVGNGWRVIIAI